MSTKSMSTIQFSDSADVYEIVDKKARENKIDKTEIDTTLSIEGNVADAKATGDAIEDAVNTMTRYVNTSIQASIQATWEASY